VVWPWRDLRLANTLGVPVTLRFAVEEMVLHAALEAPVAIAPLAVAIVRTDDATGRDVRVSRAGLIISHDRYGIAR